MIIRGTMLDFSGFSKCDNSKDFTAIRELLYCLASLKVIKRVTSGWDGKNHCIKVSEI